MDEQSVTPFNNLIRCYLNQDTETFTEPVPHYNEA